MPGSFLDSNVLIYLLSADAGKAGRAHEVVAEGGAVSVQVLNEVASVARRKIRMNWAETNSFLDTLKALLIVHPLTVDIHVAGLKFAERYGLSIYDAMIAAAALHAGCHRLWSEDMQHGLRLEGGLRIENPFRSVG